VTVEASSAERVMEEAITEGPRDPAVTPDAGTEVAAPEDEEEELLVTGGRMA